MLYLKSKKLTSAISKNIKLLTLITLLTISAQASAACGNVNAYANATARITVDPKASIGSVLATFSANWPETYSCTEYVRTVSYTGEGAVYNNLYPSPFPGISYRIRFLNPTGNVPGNNWPINITTNAYLTSLNAATVSIDLIKTGTTISGGIWPSSSPFGRAYRDNNIAFTILPYGILEIVVPQRSCTVTQSAITINLDNAETAELKTSGKTTKDKSFNIPINCPDTRNISLQFSGTMADNSKGVLKNLKTNSGNAGSLGIQLLRNGTPVQTGTSYYIGNVTGSQSIPMAARYYALANDVSPGDIQSVAYATIIYN